MADEIQGIADQLERSYRGEAWHGPALRTLLTGVDAGSAAARPIPGVHTIWELTHHAMFWLDVVRRRLFGEVVAPMPGDDWKTITEPTPERWDRLRIALDATHNELLAAIRTLPATALDRIVPGKEYTNYVMLHGAAQHNIYHAGQIAVVLRAMQPEQ